MITNQHAIDQLKTECALLRQRAETAEAQRDFARSEWDDADAEIRRLEAELAKVRAIIAGMEPE